MTLSADGLFSRGLRERSGRERRETSSRIPLRDGHFQRHGSDSKKEMYWRPQSRSAAARFSC